MKIKALNLKRILVLSVAIALVSGCSSVGCGKARLFDGKIVLTVEKIGGDLEATGSIDGEEKGKVKGKMPAGLGGNWCSPRILSGAFRGSIQKLVKEVHGDACDNCTQTGKPCSMLVVVNNSKTEYSLSGNICTISCPAGSVTIYCAKCSRNYPLCEIQTSDSGAAGSELSSGATTSSQVCNERITQDSIEIETCHSDPTADPGTDLSQFVNEDPAILENMIQSE